MALPVAAPVAAAPSNVVAGAWLTGIEEVELPLAYKVRNLEETAKATRHLQQPRNAAGPHAPRGAPANFNSFSAARSVYHASSDHSGLLATLRSNADAAAEPLEPAAAAEADRDRKQKRADLRNKATDFAVAAKFKKFSAGRR